MNPTARLLPHAQRLHLQHGPSDLIIWAEGERNVAYQAAVSRFETVIAEIVEELSLLREMLSPLRNRPAGAVARRMYDACTPFAADAYVTSMAAVAGSVADEVLKAMTDHAKVSRAYVNNGGDIALHLASDTSFETAMLGHNGTDLGRIKIAAEDGIGGIATSGQHGRSHSLGIADSVTVLARSAAMADAAATLIANEVDLPGHPAITRRPASELDGDSDLTDLQVVTACGHLNEQDCTEALDAGRRRAQAFQDKRLIISAALFLQGHAKSTGAHLLVSPKEDQYVEA